MMHSRPENCVLFTWGDLRCTDAAGGQDVIIILAHILIVVYIPDKPCAGDTGELSLNKFLLAALS